jgi:hypothetical protein
MTFRTIALIAALFPFAGGGAQDCSCHSDPPSEEHLKAARATMATGLCAHLTALGCEQRPNCEKERAFHLDTRDMRVDCLMKAASRDEILACGTVTCPPPRRFE